MKITVSVTNDLITDQRVHKVCESLTLNGYEVKLIGRKFRNSKPIERIYKTKRLRLLFNRSVFFYAEYNIRLFFYLLFDKTDIFLANDTDALPANFLASKIRRKPLVFDAHEMFPEVPEVTNRKFIKAIWTKIEDFLFPKLKYSYTVCRSIADIYNEKYGINMQVVRNIPPAAVPAIITQAPIDAKGKKIILYQGAVNLGRGIEWIIDAMPYLDDFMFYVVGDGDVLQELKERSSKLHLEKKVIFTGRVPFEALPAYTVCADIGVNLLENRGLNYYYSLPNRIFDYLRMKVPVLASDFPEIRKIVAHYETGTLIDRYEPQFLAETIRKMAAQEKNERGFAAANAELSWENEAQILLQVIGKAHNEPEKMWQIAAKKCIEAIRKIDFENMDISAYNLKYIQSLMPHLDYYFDIYIQSLRMLSNLRTDSVFVDFGGGHGFLSLFLKSLGYQVIYCDFNPLSAKTISLIKAKAGFGPDYMLCGEVGKLKQFCRDNQLKPDYLIATDLIEHVYDLQDFFEQLKQINPTFEMVFTTGSNPKNRFKCKKLQSYMLQDEEKFFSQRKDFIKKNAENLNEKEIAILANLSRGKRYDDMLKMLDIYKKTGVLPAHPDDAFNTCDPETGNWTERVLPFVDYEKSAAKAGFQTVFGKGFYNERRKNKLLSFVFRILNFQIKKTGNAGFKIAPYILIKLSENE